MSARRNIKKGHGSNDRPLAAELWSRDSRAQIPAMLETGTHQPARERVDFARYYDGTWFAREIDKLWLKTWLFACREEDIPNVGDRLPFDVGPLSFLIVRAQEDTFKAFYNSCRHRGTQLCSAPESGTSIRCPYHAWEWNIDGTLKRIPSHWDFTHATVHNSSLREVQLDRWGGCLFVNADPECVSLSQALGVIPRHMQEFALERRYTAARFRKLVPANWKISIEAFQEAYHIYSTHPEAVPFAGDTQAQYDVWNTDNSHVARQIVPQAVPSMHAPSDATALAAATASAMGMQMWHYPDAQLPAFDPSKDLRAQLAAWQREAQRKIYGRDTGVPDAVVLDATLYFMFPQSAFWLTESLPFTYSFTPHRVDPALSYFDVRMVKPWPDGQPRPASSPVIEIGIDEKISDKAPAFGFLATVFDQDMGNMQRIQNGVRAADPTHHYAQLGHYQESIIQLWNDVLDEYLRA